MGHHACMHASGACIASSMQICKGSACACKCAFACACTSGCVGTRGMGVTRVAPPNHVVHAMWLLAHAAIPLLVQSLQRGLCDLYVLPCAMTMVPAWLYWFQHNQLCIHVRQRFNSALTLSRPWHYHCHMMSALRLRAAILKTSHTLLIPRIVFLASCSARVLPCPSRPLRNCC